MSMRCRGDRQLLLFYSMIYAENKTVDSYLEKQWQWHRLGSEREGGRERGREGEKEALLWLFIIRRMDSALVGWTVALWTPRETGKSALTWGQCQSLPGQRPCTWFTCLHVYIYILSLSFNRRSFLFTFLLLLPSLDITRDFPGFHELGNIGHYKYTV